MYRRLRFLPIALLPALAGCDLSMCGNRMLARVNAPDGRHAAAVFARDCGATTGFSTQVSVVGPGETPEGAGNVFVVGGEARVPLVEWFGADRLRITYGRGLAPFLRVAAVDGVRIEYRVVGRSCDDVAEISALSPQSRHRNRHRNRGADRVSRGWAVAPRCGGGN